MESSTGKFSRSSKDAAAESKELQTGNIKNRLDYEETQVLYPSVRALHSGIDVSDNVPQIQSVFATLELEISSYFNQVGYADQTGFPTNLGGMMQHLALLESLVEQGKNCVYLIYTYRSASKALPQFMISEMSKDATADSDAAAEAKKTGELRAQKIDLTKKQLDILRPEIAKFKDLIAFVTLAGERVRECLEALQEMKETGGPMHFHTHDAPGEPPAPAADGADAHGIVPEVVYDVLLRLMDIIVRISELKGNASNKTLKKSIEKDFKRYMELKIGLEEPEESSGDASSTKKAKGKRREEDFEDTLLDEFLQRDVFATFLVEVKRNALRGREQLIANMLEYVIERINGDMFVTPDDKFALVRAVPHLLLMIDGQTSFLDFKFTKFAVPLIDDNGVKPIRKIFKRFPLVPLFADKTLKLSSVLEKFKSTKFPSVDEKDDNKIKLRRKWGADIKHLKSKFKNAYKIQLAWPAMRQTFELFLTRLSLMMNRLQRAPFLKELNEGSVDTAKEVFELAKEGLLHLSSWSAALQMFLAWKYINPCGDKSLVDKDVHGWEYELCIRHNLSLEEKSIVVDIISMMKGLEGQMRAAETTIAPIIRFHLHHCIQQLVQGDLLPILHRVDKRKHVALSRLLQVRSVAADWLDGAEPREDYKTYRRKKGQVYAQHPARVVSASATQLQLLRVLVRSLYDDASPFATRKVSCCFNHYLLFFHSSFSKNIAPLLTLKTGFFTRADLEQEDIKKLHEFHEDSFFYPYLLNFSPTIKANSDLSFFWFREFWLGNLSCIQFSIEMSIPWIFTEHAIAGKVSSPAMVENMLYTLDIYNDAAHAALHVLQQQHLYDEVEAEANVVLEQVLYTISEELYSHYKDQAAARCIEKTCKFKMEEVKNRAYLTPESRRFETILAQQHVQLLGRSVNLRFLIAQIVITKLSLDVDIALKKFEASDACCIAELHIMLQVVQQTHAELSSPGICGGGPLLELDSFRDIFNEVNGTFGPTILKGRVGMQFFKALTQDLFVNFAYNSFTQRFVRAPMDVIEMELPAFKKNFVDTVFGPMCQKALRNVCELQKGFFGRAHLEAYLSLPCSGPADVPVLVDECLQFLELRILDLTYAVDFLTQQGSGADGGLDGLQFDNTLPTSVEAFKSLEAKLGRLQSFCEKGREKQDGSPFYLKREIFQMFREVGNCVAFLRDVSQCLDVRDQFHFVAVAPFLGLAPDTPAPSPSSPASSSSDGCTLSSLLNASPLVGTLQAYRALLDKSKDEYQIVVDKPAVGALADLGRKTAELAAYTFPHRGFFHSVLQAVDEIFNRLHVKSRWALSESKHGRDPALLLHNDSKLRPARFCRVWSALCFLFNVQNQPPDSDDDSGSGSGSSQHQDRDDFAFNTDLEMFGHGMSFAGCLFVHLLDQRCAYELTDYSYSVLRLRVLEEALPSKQQAEAFADVDANDMEAVNVFIDNVQAQRDLHEALFGLFESYWAVPLHDRRSVVTYAPPLSFSD